MKLSASVARHVDHADHVVGDNLVSLVEDMNLEEKITLDFVRHNGSTRCVTSFLWRLLLFLWWPT